MHKHKGAGSEPNSCFDHKPADERFGGPQVPSVRSEAASICGDLPHFAAGTTVTDVLLYRELGFEIDLPDDYTVRPSTAAIVRI